MPHTERQGGTPTLSLTSLVCLIIANMIGAGVFTTSGFALSDLGSANRVMAAWVVGGIIALSGALSYAGLVRYEPGSHHPFHKHEFAQVWYILEGEFRIGERTYGPGTMLFYPDPHFEDPLHTESGGLMLFVQYQGPSTGGRPIYEGRFNMTARKRIEEENVEA